MERIYRIEDSQGQGFYGYPRGAGSLADRLDFDCGHFENQPAPALDGLARCHADKSFRYGFKNLPQLSAWLEDVTFQELYAEGGVILALDVYKVTHGSKQCAFHFYDVAREQVLTLESVLAEEMKTCLARLPIKPTQKRRENHEDALLPGLS